MDNFITKTNYANPQTNSLRCTIPKEVVNALNINKGDSIVWNIKTENDKKIVSVKKLDL